MNNETNLQPNNDADPESQPTPSKGQQMRSKVLGLLQSPIVSGCYVLSGVDNLQVKGADYAPTDLLPGYDYVIVPVARVEGRRHGLGWVKF